MTSKAAIRAEAERLHAAFVAAGALPVEADVLLPAETLLDLYGEDIRARAYTTHDPLRGEMMLRPDFTVPVVQAHMAHGADPARYSYLGEVFRKQDRRSERASEYLQVGFELFDGAAPEAADAEVFALFQGMLADLSLRPATGDIGILMAAVRGLNTTDRRKAALLRHIWRPIRFRALLDRFCGRAAPPAARLRLLEKLAAGSFEELIAEAGSFVGLRSGAEIAARSAALLEDAASTPIAAPEAALLYDLLSLEAPAAAALAQTGEFQSPLFAHGGGLILVIDDEVSIQIAMKSLLETWGYEAITAGSCEEMLELIVAHRTAPRLIISDYRLRDNASGIDAIERLRSEYNDEIPGMLITGDTAADRLKEAQDSGFLLLHKPVPNHRLRASIAHLIESGGDKAVA
ncbi:MAG: ATP phosphoribosyltransferase regulatory subunit [Tabrizicola sp.]|nr:ATP phosphoribosyltransferase regulatory subunit [Tabrizicola sp.]